MALGAGRMNCGSAEDPDQQVPDDERAEEDADRQQPATRTVRPASADDRWLRRDRGAGRAHRRRAHAERPSAATRRASTAAAAGLDAAQRLADLGDELEVALHLARLDVARPRQVDRARSW